MLPVTVEVAITVFVDITVFISVDPVSVENCTFLEVRVEPVRVL